MLFSHASGHGQRANLAPQNMQWAIRSSRESGRSTGVRLAGAGSNLVFIDPQSLRRSTAANAAVAAAGSEPVTMATTASCLARAFGEIVFVWKMCRLKQLLFHRYCCETDCGSPISSTRFAAKYN